MRRIIVQGEKTKIVQKLEEALAEVVEGEPGYVVCNMGDPKCEIEFAPSDKSEDPDADWSELQVDYREVPD